jgi:hypothetical protein
VPAVASMRTKSPSRTLAKGPPAAASGSLVSRPARPALSAPAARAAPRPPRCLAAVAAPLDARAGPGPPPLEAAPQRAPWTRLSGAEQCWGRGFVIEQGSETSAASTTEMAEQLGAAGGGGALFSHKRKLSSSRPLYYR